MPIYLGYKDIISELIKTKINWKFKFRINIRVIKSHLPSKDLINKVKKISSWETIRVDKKM